MKITVSQLRRLIAEEAAHALSGSSVDPSRLEALDEVEVLRVVAEVGERVMGAGRRAAGMVHSYRGASNPAIVDKFADAVAELDEECRALQSCVAALKRKGAGMRAGRNMQPKRET